MNKQCYRVVFNKARGMFMVVSEVTKSQNKKAGNSSGKKSPAAKSESHSGINVSYHRLAMAILCCQSMVYTQVQAATSAIQNMASNVPVNQRAALLKAANGTPIVNIRTPNSNGLSHNTYNQFDIGSNGAILNNSMGAANTHLAGNIAGNQYLAQGVANTILNEVRSNAPTTFQGNLEVAGQRADVIIASPSGLQIQGGGFINANRATLTTGTPKIDSAGNLTGFDVNQGHIQFDNAATGNALGGDLYDGKNKNQANYVDILARAITVNGKISNKYIDIVTGNNTVDYETGATTTIGATGTRPTLAVDVSELGGIYANSINLVGTENGLGVRNAGKVLADVQIVLSNSGKIENTGTILTDNKETSLVSLNAIGKTGSIEHSGTISSYGMIDIQADKDIILNKGIIRKEDIGTATQLMPDIIRMDATGSLIISDHSEVRNFTVDDKQNIYLRSARNTQVDGQSVVGSNGGVSIKADRYVNLLEGSNTFASTAPLSIHADYGTKIDNSRVFSRGDIQLSTSVVTSDVLVQNNGILESEKDVIINAKGDVIFFPSSRILTGEDFILQSERGVLIDNIGSLKVANDMVIKGDYGVTLKNNVQPFDIGKELIIDGKQALIENSTINAKDGIHINSQDLDLTISGSRLNSDTGAVSAIARTGAIKINDLTTDANSTVLAAGSNVGITASNLKADNIVIESGATTTISGLTTAAKDTAQIGGISITSKENTNVSDSTLNSTGNTIMRSDKTLTLTNNDIQAQGIVLKTNTAKTLKDAGGLDNRYGDGDITLTNTKLATTGNNGIGIIVDAANYLNVGNSNINSASNGTLKSGNTLKLNNSQINAGKNLTIDSSERLITNGDLLPGYDDILSPSPVRTNNIYHGFSAGKTTLQAGEILSVDSASTQSYRNTDIIGGAILINSDANIAFNTNTTINATGNTKLATSKEKLIDGKAVNTLNGDLAIGSGIGDLTIDPKNITLNAAGDMSLAARGGKLHLKGYAGTEGLGSEQVVKLTAGGDISLSGKEVVVEGSDLISKKGFSGSNVVLVDGKSVPTAGINITATDGSVELKGVKNSFSNYVSPYKIAAVQKQIDISNLELVEETLLYLTTSRYSDQVYLFCTEGLRQYSDCSEAHLAHLKKEADEARKNSLYDLERGISFLWGNALKAKNEEDLKKILETSKKASTGFEHKAASLKAGKDINITAKQGVLIEGADITSSNAGISILAEGNLAATTIVGTDPTTNISRTDINNDSIRITGLADIYQQGDITGNNYSYHQLINQPKLQAKGDIKISAQGKLAKTTDAYNTAAEAYVTNNAVILNSADLESTSGNVRIDAALGNISLEAAQVTFSDGSQSSSTSRSWYGKKKTKTITSTSYNSNAVTTDIQANNISLIADGNINIYGSDLTAASTGSINLTAGKLLNLYAIEDVNKSSTEVKKRSSWLGVRYNKDNTSDTRQELSQLPAKLIGGTAYTASGGSTLLEGTVFKTLKPADIKVGVGKYADSAATVILAPITNQITTTHTQDRESTVWMKTVDQGSVVTMAQLPKFNHVPTITSPNGVVVGVPVEVTVDANNKAKTDIQKSSAELGKIALDLSKQPGYEYLATLDKDNDINWVQVDLIQKNWDYTQEGLTPGAAALIAIAITIAAGPAGSGLTASMVATNAAGIALQTQAVITLINNKGDISKTLKDMASSDTIRNMATAALTAGLGAKLGFSSSVNDPFGQKLSSAIGNGFTKAIADTAINGASFEDALKNSLRSAIVDVFAAEAYSGFVKDFDTNDFADNLAHKLAAAGVGCVAASAKNQDCDAGAIGATVGEMIGDYLVDNPFDLTSEQRLKITNIAKISAGTVALLANVDVNVASNTAGTAVENNSVFKLVSSGGKILVKTLDKLDDLRRAGKKITVDDIKTSFRDQGADELLGIADDLLTVFNSSSTPTSRLLAGFDLVVGTDLKKGSGNTANLIKDDLQRLNIAYANRNKPSNAMVKNIATNPSRRTQVMFTGNGIRKVDVLVEKFGGRAADWTKKKGWDSNGKEYHWYQLKNGPTVGWKRVGENDPF